jgi:hypothetical protein
MYASSLARCASPEWNAAYEIRLATHYDFYNIIHRRNASWIRPLYFLISEKMVNLHRSQKCSD